MKKTAILVLVLAALAGCDKLGIGGFRSAAPADAAPAAAEPKPFRAATFNMRTDCTADRGKHDWTNRVPLIVKVVEDNGFDIIGAQELKENQIADLRRELGPKGFAAVGRGRLAEGKSEGVYILFDTNRFDCVASDTFQLSETPEVWGSKSWDTDCPRTCVWARLKDRENGGRDVLVYNTHLDHLGEIARQKGVELIVGRMKAAADDGTPALLMGDFNCGPGKTNAVGIAKRAMRDTADISQTPHKGPEKTFHGWTPPVRYLIDYIFSRGPVTILSHTTHEDAPGGELPSDHLPVSVEVVFK
jgi:endonuclease/exonuclease/phosphatase family metal-dependent hydrolase